MGNVVRLAGGLVIVLTLGLAGCPPMAPCGPDTCSGCCRDDVCHESWNQSGQACGSGGEACLDCGVGSDRCQQGACIPCAAANCTGCCDGPGCRLGDSREAGGAEGAQCRDCAALGQLCTASQHCEACGPGNCPGCCLSDGTCQYEPIRAACGVAGAACVDCVPDRLFCHEGACVPCGAGNCSGCCLPDGDCNAEETASTCGLGGVPCDDCIARGQMCTWYDVHRCVDCQATTCAGCCDPDGQCQWGSEDQECGYNGHACVDCTLTGLHCDNAICR
ncbi:MAG: hypothetical protein HY906_19685 [Deltaproteobacteria bacterium]|nr:hypothetical protein [Deltaproteobacteria bacterium]